MKKNSPFHPAPLPPKIEWSNKLISYLGDAHSGIAHYNGLLSGMINPEILLAPLRVKEAVFSSRIEGTQASLEDVWEVGAGILSSSENIYLDVQEIINYTQALLFAEKELEYRKITLHLIKQIHQILMQGVRGKNKSPGEFRKTQNWIGAPGTPMEQARFIPPSPLQVENLMEELIQFIYSDIFPDKIVQLAIIHAQFEIIHPFLDGNGRMGRLLIPLFLYSKKRLKRPVFYISEYFENHRNEYYDKLLNISENNNWQDWVEYFLEAVIEQTQKDIKKVSHILDLYETSKKVFMEITHSQFAVSLLDAFFARPLISSTELMKHTRIENRITLNTLLNKLVSQNIISLKRKGKGRSPSVYAFSELLEIIQP